MNLVWPETKYLPGYVHALQHGWSPDNLRPQTALDQLARIDEDPDRFLREQVDREAKGPPIVLPDGSMVPRLPAYSLWMWDGEFCGSIGFRWQPGTTDVPPYRLGRGREVAGGRHPHDSRLPIVPLSDDRERLINRFFVISPVNLTEPPILVSSTLRGLTSSGHLAC